MENPLVSFIITDYNLPVEMLRECLASITALSLTADEREIILIDDGSAESPLAALSGFHADITYIRQPNGGLSAARNIGLRMAQGTYIQFVDGDDKLNRSPYEHVIDIARFSAPDMIVFELCRTAPDDHTYADRNVGSGCDYMRTSNIRGAACGYLFRRASLGELRFTIGIYHEDEEFTPQLLLRVERVVVTDAEAYFYRLREGSIVTSDNESNIQKRLDDTREVIVRLHTLCDTLSVPDRQAMQRRVAQLTMDYIYNVIRLLRSRELLDIRIGELRRLGLFPLPDRDYTAKYKLFRRLSASSHGLSLLRRIVPVFDKWR